MLVYTAAHLCPYALGVLIAVDRYISTNRSNTIHKTSVRHRSKTPTTWLATAAGWRAQCLRLTHSVARFYVTKWVTQWMCPDGVLIWLARRSPPKTMLMQFVDREIALWGSSGNVTWGLGSIFRFREGIIKMLHIGLWRCHMVERQWFIHS